MQTVKSFSAGQLAVVPGTERDLGGRFVTASKNPPTPPKAATTAIPTQQHPTDQQQALDDIGPCHAPHPAEHDVYHRDQRQGRCADLKGPLAGKHLLGKEPASPDL